MQNTHPRPPDLTRRLPAEILAMIFHAWKDACRSNRQGLHPDWVRATWICKRWREVALETPALWSSVLISQRVTDDPALETQLDRARGMALDVLVSNPQMSSEEVRDALGLVLAKESPVKKFKIVCRECHPAVEEFVKNIAGELVSLSLHVYTWKANSNRWQFAPELFPRLRQLALCRIIPTPGAPLLNLTRLDLTHALDEDTVPPGTGVHRLLAACPNLEVLQTDNCFGYEVEDMIEERGKHVLPVVTLPQLRSLSMDELGLDISTALGTLRLPALSTFHITANCANGRHDCEFFVIPQNITEALPPLRRSRCLSLIAGGAMNDLSLRGGPGDTFTSANGDGWSVTLTGLDDTVFGDPEFLYFSCCIRDTCGRFLARLPHLVVSSNLVRLQLHVSNGLPVARDWARVFAAMPHLRTLGLGSGALIRHALAAFEADPGLCPELEDLDLCVGVALEREEGGLAEFILRTVGTWVRGRATSLGSLTVQTRTDLDISDSDDSDSRSDSASQSDEELSDGAGSECDAESSDLAWKLCQDVGLTLKAFVRKVFLVGTDCPACGVEYEPVDWDAIRDGELRDGVAYY